MSGSDDAYAAWSRRHDGLDPRGSVWVTGWVRLTDRMAAPLAARGVSPDVVSLAAVLASAAVPLLAAAGAGWPLLAAVLAVLAGLLDGVDGAVASRRGTASSWGQVVDATADRVGDLLLVAALVALGAPLWLGTLLGAVTLLHEGARSAAQAAGLTGPGAVTVSERPTRVIVTTLACLACAAAWAVGEADVGDTLATIMTVAGLALALVALVQLLRALRRALR